MVAYPSLALCSHLILLLIYLNNHFAYAEPFHVYMVYNMSLICAGKFEIF